MKRKEGTGRRETQQRCEQILKLLTWNMKTLRGELQRYPCIYVCVVLEDVRSIFVSVNIIKQMVVIALEE